MREEELKQIFEALLGLTDFSSVSEEMKQYVEELETALNFFAERAFKAGCTAVSLSDRGVNVSKFGGDTAYDESFHRAGNTMENLCPMRFSATRFAPDTDEDVTPNQLMVRATMVRETIPPMYKGVFGTEAPRKDHEFDTMVFEYMKITRTYPNGEEDSSHAHFDAELLVSQKVPKEQFLSGEFMIPALPSTAVADSIEFWESLEFMDENPPSGG